MATSYDRFPVVKVFTHDNHAWSGWEDVGRQLSAHIVRMRASRSRVIVAVECYPGLLEDEVAGQLRSRLGVDDFFYARDAFKSPEEIDRLVSPYLGGDDPIFGFYSPQSLEDFLDARKRRALGEKIEAARGAVVVYGAAALLCCEPDLIVYADMPRRECQLRQRRDEVSNLGVDNASLKASLQYKRAFFIDWRVCDRLKQATMPRWDYLLDTTIPGHPKLVTGAALRDGLEQTASRPFRVVPFFDPAPWGGQWIRQHCNIDGDVPNYGWAFDCVPEENSLLLKFGETVVEIPSLNLVLYRPEPLLGDDIFRRFGAEFPIRFDFLDTMQGGNLSLQVHPTVGYAREAFGIAYTQDESYYMLDAGKGASVCLGLRTGIDPAAMLKALEAAQAGIAPFPAEQFVKTWPAKKHDHFLIPAGTIHCSGAEGMVLEISATPYIFTFKLWDWGRLGLDGVPRPINLQRGKKVLQWDRDEAWVANNLINRVEPVTSGPGWREEETGLHALEFIETRRHWFTGVVPHDTHGTLNVLNLVEGDNVVVESSTGAFAPFEVHYAETFIVPAAVGCYTIRPLRTSTAQTWGTLKASVRPIGAVSKQP